MNMKWLIYPQRKDLMKDYFNFLRMNVQLWGRKSLSVSVYPPTKAVTSLEREVVRIISNSKYPTHECLNVIGFGSGAVETSIS